MQVSPEVKELAAKARALAHKEGITVSQAMKRLESGPTFKQSQPSTANQDPVTSESADGFYARLVPIGDGVVFVKKIKTEK